MITWKKEKEMNEHHHHRRRPQNPWKNQMMQTQHLLSSNFFFPLIQSPRFRINSATFSSHNKPFTPTYHSVAAQNHRTTTEPWLAQVPEEPTTTTATLPPAEEEEGPIELPSSTPSIFATSDDPTPLQTATSLLLTGAISVFLFRSLRRRAKRAKELVHLLCFFNCLSSVV